MLKTNKNKKRCVAKGSANHFVYEIMSLETFCKLTGKSVKDLELSPTTKGIMLTEVNIFNNMTTTKVLWITNDQFTKNYIILN